MKGEENGKMSADQVAKLSRNKFSTSEIPYIHREKEADKITLICHWSKLLREGKLRSENEEEIAIDGNNEIDDDNRYVELVFQMSCLGQKIGLLLSTIKSGIQALLLKLML